MISGKGRRKSSINVRSRGVLIASVEDITDETLHEWMLEM